MSLPTALEELWRDAVDNPGIPVDIGDIVVCDSCNRDFTNSSESGGFVFSSYGYGPCCAPRMMEEITRYGEQRFIKARCPAAISYADFIRAYRGPDGNSILFRPCGRP